MAPIAADGLGLALGAPVAAGVGLGPPGDALGVAAAQPIRLMATDMLANMRAAARRNANGGGG
jgi:hypothetical protein